MKQVSKMKSFATLVLRKIRKVEYTNVHYIPGYESTEKEYLALRQALEDANSMIRDLMNYEHGNKYVKILKSSIQALSDTTSMNIYKSKDIFQDLGMISRRMGMMNLNEEAKLTAEKMSTAYFKLSDSKIGLNNKLENIRLQLKEKRIQSRAVDKYRKTVKNMRFDLEVLLQDSGYNGEIREAEKKEFSTFSNQAIKVMFQFIEDSSISVILKNISMEYASHLKESADILKKSGIN